MCGCMMMHGTMNHEEHHPNAQVDPGSNTLPMPDQRHCPHCGFPLQHGFAFCPGCGMSLRTATCSACGQKVDPSWSSCAFCGSPLGEVLEQPSHH